MTREPEHILQQFWGYGAFRGQQEFIIDSVLQKKDTLALLPTGGGKSLCFQVPALIMEGACLVISPLIALMKDQVENLAKRNIPALAIHSGMDFLEVKRAFQCAAQGDYKIVYLSPERLQSKLFREFLPALDISLVAVDEAHCISQWGYDFRPSYLKITALREELPGVPFLALTASATQRVQEDIIAKLGLKGNSIFRQSFDRANLSYSAFLVDSKINKAIEILKNVPGSSVIYCRNRRQTQGVAELLRLQGLSAEHYHAGLPQDERSLLQANWMNDKTRVIVCTNAFGMGIDKPGVRTVIHYDLPDCVESYYQEAGRAGRDGNRAYAVALYQREDARELEALPDLKFPPVEEIRKVYQAVADYLDIPVGLGEGNYYDFDLLEFSANFKLDLHLVMNVLKVLEQEGHLSFNENIFLPPKVNFTAPKELLEDFEQSHPSLGPLVKCLLRTYEGIYDNRVSINEKRIAKLAGLQVNEVRQQLLQLASFGIIEYLPQKETPQLYFQLNRAPAQHLHIDHTAYFERKRQFQTRVRAMLDYLEVKTCRAQFIARYFGESEAKKCGICDNCLNEKSAALSGEAFRAIEASIYHHIPDGGIDVKDLLPLINVRKEKFWQVLTFLQQERRLSVEGGKISRLP